MAKADSKGKDGNAPLQPIVIKRIKKVAGGHHGGAWKIAYADFVTAMMAFFLLMWLLGSTSKGDLKGIADYFNSPLKVAMQGGSGSGDSSSIINGGGQDLTRQSGQVKSGENAPEHRAMNLQAAKAEFQRRGARATRRAESPYRSGDQRQLVPVAVQEPDPPRHHGRSPAHPDRRRTEPADVRLRARRVE